MAKDTRIDNPFLRRYSPMQRYTKGDGFAIQSAVNPIKVDYGKSITDKESYRLNLASARGSALGSGTVGQYMYQDGKYDVNYDFSFIMRKDLTVQEIDNYINFEKARRESADEELKKEIDARLSELQKKRSDVSQTSDTSDTSTSEK